MQRRFEIGDHAAVKDRGCTREGRIVGSELVEHRDYRGRSPGRWLTLRIAGTLFEDVAVPESSLGGILSPTA